MTRAFLSIDAVHDLQRPLTGVFNTRRDYLAAALAFVGALQFQHFESAIRFGITALSVLGRW